MFLDTFVEFHIINLCTYLILFYILGPVPTKDMTPPPPLRSGHLDIKMRNVLKIKMGIKFHITSRLSAAAVEKGRFGKQEFNFLQKWPNMQGILELI